MNDTLSKYPKSFRLLPVNFQSKATDNSKLLSLGRPIYGEPFHLLEPSQEALGVNARSTKVNTSIEFGEFYVVWAVGTTLYKIGATTDFNRRFHDLSAYSPLPLKVVKYGRCDNPHLLEAHIHGLFSKKLFKNEWYSLKQADVDTLDQIFDRYFERFEAA